MTKPDTLITRLEVMGEHQVRLLFENGGFPTTLNLIVTQWLREKREAAEKAETAIAEKQTEIASSARDATWASARAAERSAAAAESSAKEARRANWRANFAIVISILALLAGLLSLQPGGSIPQRVCGLLSLPCSHP